MAQAKIGGKAVGDWESSLGKPGSVCEDCAKPFEVGDSFVSVLAFQETGLARREVCVSCFEKAETQAFAFWRSRVLAPDAKKRRPLDLNFLVEFFNRLLTGGGEPDQVEVGYIVALLLVRKKVLEQLRTETDDDEREFMIVRFKSKEEELPEHRIFVPDLTPERMEIIRDDLARIFNL